MCLWAERVEKMKKVLALMIYILGGIFEYFIGSRIIGKLILGVRVFQPLPS